MTSPVIDEPEDWEPGTWTVAMFNARVRDKLRQIRTWLLPSGETVIGSTAIPWDTSGSLGFGAGSIAPRIRMEDGRHVSLWGVVNITGGTLASTTEPTMFTLPAKWRPAETKRFAVPGSNGTSVRITVDAGTGAVAARAINGSPSGLFLDPIIYPLS